MADTFRSMCSELVQRWDAANGDHDLHDVADAMDRTRTLLAQPVAERAYFYCAFRQQSIGALRYFSGIAVLSVEHTSPNFPRAVCEHIAELAGDPGIHDQLILQSLTLLDPHYRG